MSNGKAKQRKLEIGLILTNMCLYENECGECAKNEVKLMEQMWFK